MTSQRERYHIFKLKITRVLVFSKTAHWVLTVTGLCALVTDLKTPGKMKPFSSLLQILHSGVTSTRIQSSWTSIDVMKYR